MASPRSDWGRPLTLDVLLGEKGNQIRKKVSADIAIDPGGDLSAYGSRHGFVQIGTRGGWCGKVPSDAGEMDVELSDNGNGVYGDRAVISAQGALQAPGNSVRIWNRTGVQSTTDIVRAFAEAVSYSGKLYQFETTKAGDTFTIKPYTGPAGTLHIDARDGNGKSIARYLVLGGPMGELRLERDNDLLLPVGE